MEKTVLIVDDSEFARQELRSAYTAAGFKVVGEAKDGIEALKMCSELLPEFVSLDLIMPHMHGIECAREIMKSHPKMGLVFVTSLARDIIRDHSFGDEFDAECFIQKPATSADLKAAVLHIFDPQDSPQININETQSESDSSPF